jgi:hypothetical protein
MLTSTLQWGDLAEWASTLFGLGALVVALLALLREQRARDLDQQRYRAEQLDRATSFARRLVFSYKPQPEALVGAMLSRGSILIENLTDRQFYSITVQAHIPNRPTPRQCFVAELGARKSHEFPVDRVGHGEVFVTAQYDDEDGRRWERRQDGIVVAVNSQSAKPAGSEES